MSMKFTSPKQPNNKYFTTQPKPFMKPAAKRIPRKPSNSALATGTAHMSQRDVYGKAMKRAFKNTTTFGVGEK